MDMKDVSQRWTVAGKVELKHSERASHVVNILILLGGPFQLGDGMMTASLGHCGIPRAGDPMQYDFP